jgi:hypothetical protein
METLLLHINIALYRYCFGRMCTLYRFVLLSVQIGIIIAFGTLEKLSLLLVTALGIIESLSLLTVTLWE